MKHLRVVTNAIEDELVGNHVMNDNYSMIVNIQLGGGRFPIYAKFVKEGSIPVYAVNHDMYYYASPDEPIADIIQGIIDLTGDEDYSYSRGLYQRDDNEGWYLDGNTIKDSTNYDSRYQLSVSYEIA